MKADVNLVGTPDIRDITDAARLPYQSGAALHLDLLSVVLSHWAVFSAFSLLTVSL